MDIERIEELMQKSSWTTDEKNEIAEAAKEAGCYKKPKKGKFCDKCYDEMLVALYEKHQPQKNTSKDGWQLKNVRKDIVIGGQRINNGNIADFAIEEFPNTIINQFFSKNANIGESKPTVE